MQNGSDSLRHQELTALLEMMRHMVEREAAANEAFPWKGLALTIERCLRLTKKAALPASRRPLSAAADEEIPCADILEQPLERQAAPSLASRLRKLPPLQS